MNAARRVPLLALLLILALTFSGSGVGEAGQKTTHVKAYTKKDGTTVAAHERKAPEPQTSTPQTTTVPHATSAPIRVVTDPVSRQRTLTNEPLPPLPATPLSSTATFFTPAQATGRQARPASTVVAIPRAAYTAVIPPSGSVVRDAQGRIQRSAAARHAFARQTGFPNGRPGYVIDHKKALACGGADVPANMQWQTIAEAHLKDKTERIGCR